MWTIEERETYTSIKNSLRTIASAMAESNNNKGNIYVVQTTYSNCYVEPKQWQKAFLSLSKAQEYLREQQEEMLGEISNPCHQIYCNEDETTLTRYVSETNNNHWFKIQIFTLNLN